MSENRAVDVLSGFLFFIAVFLHADLVLSQEVSKGLCLSCHGVRGLEKVQEGKPVSLYVDIKRFDRSVHAVLECTSCHGDVSQVPHASELKPVQCSGCHPDASRDYSRSVHGRSYMKGSRDAARCRDCHGSHEILAAKNPDSKVYPLNLPQTCGQCHGDPELAKRHGIAVGNAYQLYMDSIHGRALSKSGLLVAANCSSCHGAHGVLPSSAPGSTVHRANIADTCGQCHAGILKIYSASVHGRRARAGDPLAPVCIDCHTAHEIRRVAMEDWKLEIVRECGSCHRESFRTYRDTFHGQVTALGFTRVARCSDCHGSHDILPKSDSRSSVGPGLIVATCRKCHPSANNNFVKYDPHADAGNRVRNPVLYYSSRFMTWLLVGVFAFFGLHTILWAGRPFFLWIRKSFPSDEDEGKAPDLSEPRESNEDGEDTSG